MCDKEQIARLKRERDAALARAEAADGALAASEENGRQMARHNAALRAEVARLRGLLGVVVDESDGSGDLSWQTRDRIIDAITEAP